MSSASSLGSALLGVNGSTNLQTYINGGFGNASTFSTSGEQNTYMKLTLAGIVGATSTIVTEFGFYTGTTTWKPISSYAAWDYADSPAISYAYGTYKATSAITSLLITNGNGVTFNGGTIYLYGVK